MDKEIKIDAYKYATDFESLSLKVVKIIIKEEFPESTITSDSVTKKTRDNGIDAYALIEIKSNCVLYTVEAKLRNKEILSLKDFATSILYYLINASLRHFVVTNVSFSSEVIKYIIELNRHNSKAVDLIDGSSLKRIINENKNSFSEIPNELLQFIQKKELPDRTIQTIQTSPDNYKYSDYIAIPSREKIMKEAISNLENGKYHFVIEGDNAVGKSLWINMFLCHLTGKYKIKIIDLTAVKTPRMLVMEFLNSLLGISMQSILANVDFDKNTVAELLITGSSDTQEIIEAVYSLINADSTDYNTYIWLMHLLIDHIKPKFSDYNRFLWVMQNLHMADEQMIQFVIEMIRQICCPNLVVIWELATMPIRCAGQKINIEEWLLKTTAIKTLFSNTGHSQVIALKNFTKDEVRYAVREYLSDVKLTNDFYEEFFKDFGVNPGQVFEVLKIIKYQKAYSKTALLHIQYSVPELIKERIIYFFRNENSIYKEAYIFALFFHGKIDKDIIVYLDEKYFCNSEKMLLDSGLFSKSFKSLFLSRDNLIILEDLIPLSTIEKYAEYILNHFEMSEIDKKYYNAKYFLLTSSPMDIREYNNTISYMKKHYIDSYVFELLKYRYFVFENKYNSNYGIFTENDELDYYCYYIEYLDFAQRKTLLPETDLISNIQSCENLRISFARKHSAKKNYIKASIDFSIIKYRIAKAKYDYNACEEIINYVLSFEDSVDLKDKFANAHKLSALNKKERGRRKEMIAEFAEALKKYPHNKNLKISYYVNLAAMYKHFDIKTALKLLEVVQQITFNTSTACGNLEAKIGILHLRCYSDIIEPDEIQAVRILAEKNNSLANLAKIYNLEAYYHLKTGNYDQAVPCLETAVFHCLTRGSGKPFFLFCLNLLTILSSRKEDCMNKMKQVEKWFLTHKDSILERLNNNPYRKNDHMYAAIISYTILRKRIYGKNVVFPDTKYMFLKELLNKEEKSLLDSVPDYYKLRKQVFILF